MKVIVWAIPRSVSTAFEKAFIQNNKVKVLHEPFSIPYYFGKQSKSNRYNSKNSKTFLDVLNEIKEEEGNLFIKDMAYYIDEFIDMEEGNELIESFEHAFLFRDPVKSIYSLYEGSFNKEMGWNSFNETEIGYSSLKKVYEKCVNKGKKVMVIESDNFLSNVENTLRTFCDFYGFQYTSSMLKLEKYLDEWNVWEPWHKDAIQNKEFYQKEKDYDRDILQRIKPYIDNNEPFYTFFVGLM